MGELVKIHDREHSVQIIKGKAVTTSLDVAEKFKKRHDNVMRDIRRIIESAPERSLLNFEEIDYTNDRGRKQPMFIMSRTGFSVLAMGFTGKKALQWKFAYDEAFNQMEQALLRQNNEQWKQTRLDSKAARRLCTDVIQHFVDYATAQGSQNARLYYMNITNMVNKALFLVGKASPQPFRDMLDAMQLSFLTAAEYVAQEALKQGMAEGLHYKDIYQLAREKVTAYAAALPRPQLLTGGSHVS